MIPILTPLEMAVIDASASESTEILIKRAGTALARGAINEMGGWFLRRVSVLAGKGSNGADGIAAARRLTRYGIRAKIFDVAEVPEFLPSAHLVIDAAFGTGLRRPWNPPATGSPVLAADLPSGVDPLTGCVLGEPLQAKRTMTFAALKPGLLFGEGRRLAGEVEVVDIGLDVSSATSWLLTDADIPSLIANRPFDAHKWQSACWVIAGSSGMEGAANLAVTAAQRAGAGYIRLSVPGLSQDISPPEVVNWPINHNLDLEDFEIARFSSFVIGPGLGRSNEVLAGVRRLTSNLEKPLVIDGDALFALGDGTSCRDRVIPAILTPHDGEFASLMGSPPTSDRLDSARMAAKITRSVVLLKGSTTVVAEPSGQAIVVTTGDQRLATAGSGDVLAGIIGAFLARGAKPFDAAAAGAHVHGRLLSDLSSTGVIAGDLVSRLADTLITLGVDNFSKGTV